MLEKYVNIMIAIISVCLFSTRKQINTLQKRGQFDLRWIFSLLADNSLDGLFSSEDDSSSSSSSED